MKILEALLLMAAIGCGGSYEAPDVELTLEEFLGSVPYSEARGGYLLDGRVLSEPELRAHFEARLAEGAGPDHDAQTGCGTSGGGDTDDGSAGSDCGSGPQPIPEPDPPNCGTSGGGETNGGAESGCGASGPQPIPERP